MKGYQKNARIHYCYFFGNYSPKNSQKYTTTAISLKGYQKYHDNPLLLLLLELLTKKFAKIYYCRNFFEKLPKSPQESTTTTSLEITHQKIHKNLLIQLLLEITHQKIRKYLILLAYNVCNFFGNYSPKNSQKSTTTAIFLKSFHLYAKKAVMKWIEKSSRKIRPRFARRFQ